MREERSMSALPRFARARDACRDGRGAQERRRAAPFLCCRGVRLANLPLHGGRCQRNHYLQNRGTVQAPGAASRWLGEQRVCEAEYGLTLPPHNVSGPGPIPCSKEILIEGAPVSVVAERPVDVG